MREFSAYDKSGNSWEGPAPEDVVSGQAIMLGVQLAIAAQDALEGEMCTFSLAGVFEVPSSGDAHDVGQPLHRADADGTLYAGTPEAGDWANVAMSFSPGGGPLSIVSAKINTHPRLDLAKNSESGKVMVYLNQDMARGITVPLLLRENETTASRKKERVKIAC